MGSRGFFTSLNVSQHVSVKTENQANKMSLRSMTKIALINIIRYNSVTKKTAKFHQMCKTSFYTIHWNRENYPGFFYWIDFSDKTVDTLSVLERWRGKIFIKETNSSEHESNFEKKKNKTKTSSTCNRVFRAVRNRIRSISEIKVSMTNHRCHFNVLLGKYVIKRLEYGSIFKKDYRTFKPISEIPRSNDLRKMTND